MESDEVPVQESHFDLHHPSVFMARGSAGGSSTAIVSAAGWSSGNTHIMRTVF